MKKTIIMFTTVLVLAGAGCNTVQPTPPVQTVTPYPHANWKTISPGGVVTLQIPPNCNAEGAAGSTFITCPTPDNETPIPEFVISSDGIQVNIKRWEDLESPYWNEVISTLKVNTPLTQAIQINIEK